MGKIPTPPFKLTPILLRYLHDIQFNEERHLDSVGGASGLTRLVRTWVSKEVYPIDHDSQFVEFKLYFEREKILRFQDLDDYDQEHGIIRPDHERRWSIEDSDPYRHEVFDKEFPVAVLDLKKLRAFRAKYKKMPAKTPVVAKKKLRTDYRRSTKVLSSPAVKSHEFTTRRHGETIALRVLEELWDTREHTIKGKIVRKRNNPPKFDHFAVKMKLVTDSMAISPKFAKDKRVKVKKQIENVGAGLRREGFPIEIKCTRNEVLLTVND